MADEALLAALGAIAARGAIGEASLERAVAHAQQFVDALPPDPLTLVDLGSGGGLPGLVIAVRRPTVEVTLVERRLTRADMLRRAVAALGLGDRVIVLAHDVREVANSHPAAFDVVTARSFAAPAVTARWGGRLLHPDGLLLVSEPPTDLPQRWEAGVLAAAGLVDLGREQGIRRFRRSGVLGST